MLEIFAWVVGWYVFAYWATNRVVGVAPKSVWVGGPGERLFLWLVSPLPPFCIILAAVGFVCATKDLWESMTPGWNWLAGLMFSDDQGRRACR